MRTTALLLASLLVLLHAILPSTVDSLALGGGREAQHRQGCGGRRIRSRVGVKRAWPDRRGGLNSDDLFWEVTVPTNGVQRRDPFTETEEEVVDAGDPDRVQYNPNAWSRFGRSMCP
ncbi:uncharacterized protein [Branchiostoma lanceolatum]|uniref:Hypp9785 protein n=1 Tax=Branchiostoma lanceolatum TaxID=7740 RepID=A0A8S4MPI1_BRALA|nr:Hypp9785 [Branchiostoma lanceolatum]